VSALIGGGLGAWLLLETRKTPSVARFPGCCCWLPCC
jgi:hypothetical protein